MNACIQSKYPGVVFVLGLVIGLIATSLALTSVARADLPPYEFNPELSLTSDCSTSGVDPIPDPGCPYSPPPAGPTESNCNLQGCSSRFEEPRAIAIDFYGNEYVATVGGSDEWIRVFDDEGIFLTELAVPPLKSLAIDSEGSLYAYTTDARLLRFEPSTYKPEVGEVEYQNPAVEVAAFGGSVGAVAVDALDDHVFVTRPSKILEYGSAEEVGALEGNKLLATSEPEKLGTWTESIAIDASRRRLYVSYCKSDTSDCGVLVLDADDPEIELEEITGSTTPAGEFAPKFALLGIAIDEELGYLFIQDFIASPGVVYQFGEDYEYLSSLTDSRFAAKIALQIAVSNGETLSVEPCDYPEDVPLGDACNRHFLFIPTLPASGQLGNRALAYEPPGEQAPEIKGVSAAGIGETQAQLQAIIDPQGSATTYRFEITTQANFDAKKFEGAKIAGEGVISATSLETQVSVPVSGLTPGETYRFRAVAKNAIGDAEEAGQNEATFATYFDAPISPLCPNKEVRVGPSARLPDCRAYELVTPPDTNGRPPKGTGFVGEMFPTVFASPDGSAVSFKVEGGSLPGTSGIGSFEGDPYIATRGSSGWKTALPGPKGGEATVSILGGTSLDQGHLFWKAGGEGPLVVNGQDTRYIRYPDGHSELTGQGSLGNDPSALGTLITENGTHVIFESVVKLEPDAPPNGTLTVYDRTSDEVTHVVSLLPGDITPAAGQNATYQGASKDGNGVAFAIGNKLYLRLGNETTYEIGENVTFAGISEGGGRIFYLEGGDLEAFDADSEEVVEFSTSGNVTPVNVSNDGTRAYFVSPSVLGGANPQGDSAQPGEQNLYLSEEGAISFIATVTDRDVEGEPEPEGVTHFDGLGLWTKQVGRQIARDPSRTNSDGSVLVFQSRANITGYAESEFPQIYRYDSEDNRLHCISCIPTGVAATGGASLETYGFASDTPPPFSPHTFIPNLSPDGDRVFFESKEALVSFDTDEVQDIYEWEEEGVGGCARIGGCVYLISSGQSERDNFLYAHSESGDDVFFTTSDILTGFDGGGTTSIYDARVNGGFAEDVKPPCVDEGCLLPLLSPPAVLPPAQSTSGDDNVKGGPKPRRCPKGKRKVKKNGKVRCVKKKNHKKQKGRGGKAKQRAGASGGAGK